MCILPMFNVNILVLRYFLDPKSGHYPGAVNIPFPSLFNTETRKLKTVEELKKGKSFPSGDTCRELHELQDQ